MEIRDPKVGAEGVLNFCKSPIRGLYIMLKSGVTFYFLFFMSWDKKLKNGHWALRKLESPSISVKA
jgi:hypothetical protein